MPVVTSSNIRILITDFVWPSTAPERSVLAAGLGDGVAVVEAPDRAEATLARLASDCDGIMTCFAQVTPAVVQAARRCRVISRYGVGVDNIAVDTATALGIPVTYVPDYCVDEVSDHTMALLLAWNRQVGFYDRIAKAGRWQRFGGGVSQRRAGTRRSPLERGNVHVKNTLVYWIVHAQIYHPPPSAVHILKLDFVPKIAR